MKMTKSYSTNRRNINGLERKENSYTALVDRNIAGTDRLEDLIVDGKKKNDEGID
jgi:hypothetical protein